MNLRNKLKKFFTLNPRHEAGFTLVELIVVIAILAILGGVGTAAYSGYIKKANMTADETLISDIEKALTLAYYSGDLEEGSAGFLMLSPNEGESFDDYGNSLVNSRLGGPTATAMEKAFGSNWMDAMQLAYDNWGVSWNIIEYDKAKAVAESNFGQKYSPEELMSEVQDIVNAANALADVAFTNIKDMYNYVDDEGATQNAVDELIGDYYPEGTTWDDITDPAERSNLLVLATAASVSGGYEAAAVDPLTQYAVYTAYAAEGDGVFNEKYDEFKYNIANLDSNVEDQYNAIKTYYTNFKNWANSYQPFTAWAGEIDDEADGGFGVSYRAFDAIMAGVGSAMNENGDAILVELNDPEMFTSGIGYEMYNDYLNSAIAMANGPDILEDLDMSSFPGCVLMQYAVVDGVLYLATSMPAN